MRLVIDLQGAQTGSRYRGIGRYSLSLAKGIASVRGKHEVIVALSDLFPETIDPIRAEFADLLPPECVRIWHAVGPTCEVDSENKQRREISERLREAFLAELRPDVILVTSLFEGLGDDAVGSVGLLSCTIPTAVILYDLIPLVNPDEHFGRSQLHIAWYKRKIEFLERSDLLLAISESSRQEALHTSQFARKTIVNISGASDGKFRVLSLSAGEIHDTWSRLSITRPFAMYTGGSDERKNLPRLIKAFAKLPDEIRSQHQLVLAGKMPDGQVESYLRTAKTSGLRDDELVITGYLIDDDLLKLYNTCALFVFPSLHEGFGIPPLEAMACGAPVIAANATSLPEVIGLSDALFDPTSVPEISAKLQRVLTDDRFRRKLVDHGQEQFKKFSWTRSAATALSALEGLVSPRKARVSELLNIQRTSLFKRRLLRILAIKLDHLGDFILALPALAKLRARFPYATIDILVGSWNKSIAERTGLFDAIHIYDFFRQKSSDPPKKHADDLSQLLASLREYDIALDFRRPADTRFLLAKVRAAMKIGYGTFDDSIDSNIDIVLKQYKDASSTTTPLNRTSISVQMLRVVDAIPSDPNDFIKFPPVGDIQDRQQGMVAIFPKAGSAVREWSKSNFEGLVELLVADPLVDGVNIYFASAREASQFAFVGHEKVSTNVGLQTAELTQSLSRNSVCIANNSGGAHLAAYLGVTTIALYSGHELSAEWGPQFFDSLVIHREAQCAPCHCGSVADCPNSLFCLNDIHVDDVYGKTIEAIYVNQTNADTTRPNTFAVSLQRNTDSIVGELLSSIAKLPGSVGSEVIDTSVAISKNHPEYSMNPNLRSFALNSVTDHRSTVVDWRGFSGIERDFRWSDGNNSVMLFECPARTHSQGVLFLHIDCQGRQRIVGHLNGTKVVDTVESGRHVQLRIPVRNLVGGLNRLEFEFPDARQPGNGDSRKLAIAVREFTVQATKRIATANIIDQS
jgi:glycosyltransferase involved in cell wall biosynthesis/ADP-heptose:LPS heptosyltransferase